MSPGPETTHRCAVRSRASFPSRSALPPACRPCPPDSPAPERDLVVPAIGWMPSFRLLNCQNRSSRTASRLQKSSQTTVQGILRQQPALARRPRDPQNLFVRGTRPGRLLIAVRVVEGCLDFLPGPGLRGGRIEIHAQLPDDLVRAAHRVSQLQGPVGLLGGGAVDDGAGVVHGITCALLQRLVRPPLQRAVPAGVALPRSGSPGRWPSSGAAVHRQSAACPSAASGGSSIPPARGSWRASGLRDSTITVPELRRTRSVCSTTASLGFRAAPIADDGRPEPWRLLRCHTPVWTMTPCRAQHLLVHLAPPPSHPRGRTPRCRSSHKMHNGKTGATGLGICFGGRCHRRCRSASHACPLQTALPSVGRSCWSRASGRSDPVCRS